VFGEVFICEFPFTSGTASKPRPVLALFDLQQDVIICRITSVLRSGPLDVTLADWQQAGLAKPSVARLDRLVTAERAILRRRIGHLSARDETAVGTAWNQHMRI
jgi:mRNA interferase MazF